MTTKIVLPTELTIYRVAELHAHWLDLLGRQDNQNQDGIKTAATTRVTIEAGQVDEVDAAGIQLLLSLARTMKRQSRPLRMENASTTLRRACVALGVADHLFEPLAEGSIR